MTSKPDEESVSALEANGFTHLVREFLALDRLVESGELVTEADLEDGARALAEPYEPSEEVAAHAAVVARMIVEAQSQAAPGTGAA